MFDSSSHLLISGAGPVGLTLALLLSDSGLNITLVDAAPLDLWQQDSRVIALSEGARQTFARAHVWEQMVAHASSIQQVVVGEQGSSGRVTIHSQTCGVEALGQVVEAHVIIRALREQLSHRSHIQWLQPLQIQQVQEKRITFSDHSVHQTQLLVAAEGATSFLRERAHIGYWRWDYGQSAIIAQIDVELPHQQRAWEYFTAQGPMALLPLAPQRMAAVIIVDRLQAAAWKAYSDEEFLMQLQQRFGFELGSFSHPSQRKCWPLSMLMAQQLSAQDVVLVGNSGHTLHPIAGQGLNLGLRDVACLAQLLREEWLRNGRLGAVETLRAYEAKRLPDIRRTLAATDALVRIFSPQWQPIKELRNLGLHSLEHFPFLKQQIAHLGMGIAP